METLLLISMAGLAALIAWLSIMIALHKPPVDRLFADAVDRYPHYERLLCRKRAEQYASVDPFVRQAVNDQYVADNPGCKRGKLSCNEICGCLSDDPDRLLKFVEKRAELLRESK